MQQMIMLSGNLDLANQWGVSILVGIVAFATRNLTLALLLDWAWNGCWKTILYILEYLTG